MGRGAMFNLCWYPDFQCGDEACDGEEAPDDATTSGGFVLRFTSQGRWVTRWLEVDVACATPLLKSFAVKPDGQKKKLLQACAVGDLCAVGLAERRDDAPPDTDEALPDASQRMWFVELGDSAAPHFFCSNTRDEAASCGCEAASSLCLVLARC